MDFVTNADLLKAKFRPGTYMGLRSDFQVFVRYALSQKCKLFVQKNLLFLGCTGYKVHCHRICTLLVFIWNLWNKRYFNPLKCSSGMLFVWDQIWNQLNLNVYVCMYVSVYVRMYE